MLRIVWGVIAGFLAWLVVWVVSEMSFSAISPEWYGAHQRAFTAAIKSGGQFSADATILLMQIVLGAIVSVIAGFLAALIARENKRAPLIVGLLLLILGLLKAAMSWPYVPIWYHVIFTALLVPMAILGGKLKAAATQ